MRPIKFRGKTEEGEWLEGYLDWEVTIDGYKEYTIHTGHDGGLEGYYVVIPETIGQFTGFHDNTGKEIYEGDIITLSYGIPPKREILVIEYADDENVADISVSGWWMRNLRPNGCTASLCKTYESDIEIIGNVPENPELLEAKRQK